MKRKSNNEFKRDNAMSRFLLIAAIRRAGTAPFNALRLNSMLDGRFAQELQKRETMDIETVFTSPINTAYAGIVTITCLFILIYENYVSINFKNKFHSVLNNWSQKYSSLNLAKYVENTAIKIDRFLIRLFKKPSVYNVFDNYFWNESIVLISSIIMIIPLIVLSITNSIYYLFGASSFLTLLFAPVVFRKNNFPFKHRINWFVISSIYNFSFYAIPSIIFGYILGNKDTQTFFEIKRLMSFSFSFHVFTPILIIGFLRVTIHKIAYSKEHIKIGFCFLFIILSSLILFFNIFLLQLDNQLINNMHSITKDFNYLGSNKEYINIIGAIIVLASVNFFL